MPAGSELNEGLGRCDDLACSRARMRSGFREKRSGSIDEAHEHRSEEIVEAYHRWNRCGGASKSEGKQMPAAQEEEMERRTELNFLRE